MDAMLNIVPASLCYIALPEAMVGKAYGDMYNYLALTSGIIPIGLLRHRDIDMQNRMPFVYTNPVSSLKLLPEDLVYVLATSDQIE
jgi:hypothetical protein